MTTRLLLPALLLSLVTATGARAAPEAAPTRATPAEIGRLLLSDDAGERERGATLLLAELARAGDRALLLDAVASESAAAPFGEERLLARWVDEALHGAPEERQRALRLLAAYGPVAHERLRQAREAEEKAVTALEAPTPVPAEPAAPAGPAAAPPEAAKPEPAGAKLARPRVELEASVALVPAAEVVRWLHGPDAQHEAPGTAEVRERVARLARGVPVQAAGEAGRRLGDVLTGLPETRSLVDRQVGLSAGGDVLALLEGGTIHYRRGIRPLPRGGWVVSTDTLPQGLQIVLALEKGEGGLRVRVEARWVEVPLPLATREVRPAPGIEPLEIDVPEWRVTKEDGEVALPSGGDGAVLALPGVAPGGVVVIGLAPAEADRAH